MENHNFVLESVIVKENDGFYSLCLDVDVASQGDTIEEARSMLIEAVELYLESSIEHGLPALRRTPDEANPLLMDIDNVVEHFSLKLKLELTLDA
ncbi:MAG: type II toxin-antitoxin system HicB family antitoxin [Ignavibacteria bacterium]|nr:type II toxin-antitoxin system HicB family antitoxin [Ignavibacteria bacterium]